MKPILIVDDQPAIADLIAMILGQSGYTCQIAYSGKAAADLLEKTDFSLALLDIMLPEIDGYDLLDYAVSLTVPVIFITAKGSTKDRVKGLRLGADDYIVKPFEPEELLARVESLLRRTASCTSVLKKHGVVLDTKAHTVTQDGKPVLLTPREFDLLAQLLGHCAITLERETLYSKVWGENADFDSRTLDLHINRIRKKLGWQQQIRTVYRIGYILEEDPS